MISTNEPMPPEARKAIRLAIATHLVANMHITMDSAPASQGEAVDRAYSLADLLIGKSGL